VFKNGRINNFEGLVTLTLYWVILHTVVHHLSTSTYMPDFTDIEDTFCGWTDVHMDGWTDGHLRPTLLGRLKSVDLIKTLRYCKQLYRVGQKSDTSRTM